jgi:hypothetical protein
MGQGCCRQGPIYIGPQQQCPVHLQRRPWQRLSFYISIYLYLYLYLHIHISIYREQQLQCWFPPDLSPLHNLLLLQQAGMCGARVTQVGSAKAVETPKHIRREGPVPTRLPPSRYHHHHNKQSIQSIIIVAQQCDTMMVGWLDAQHNTTHNRQLQVGGKLLPACGSRESV